MTESESRRKRRFDGLFASYSSDVVAYCSWRAGSRSDSQDAVADVFLTAWRRLDDVPDGDAARVWLYATARRVIANQRRSSRRCLALQERLAREPVWARAESPSPRREETLVHEALRRLRSRDRDVEAGLIARESGFKEGQSIRVLPFGYVAHDEAANAAAPLDVAVTVAADDIVREIAVTWGTSASAWTYTVAYSRLGETPAPVAPAKARDLLKERLGAD